MTADDLPTLPIRHLQPTKTEQAAEWLRGQLSSGRKRSSALFQAAKKAGFPASTLRDARDRIGAEAIETADGWVWRLTRAKRRVG